jgi:dolichyl-phosphate beta-glucosyltransferase
MSGGASVVLPFYNESQRLDHAELTRLGRTPDLRLLLVDDGSADDTADLLAKVAAEVPDAQVLRLEVNAGKAEAVRRGLLHELDRGARTVGYADGDLATPVDELRRLAALAASSSAGAQGVLGARVRLAGRHIVRRGGRHYLGRVIATYIDLRAGLDVYDTQCGAKFFQASPELRAALRKPFMTRWLFDVELLHRLCAAAGCSGRALLREEPLENWEDVAGSRIRGRELVRVARDFWLLERSLREDRRG